MMRAQSAMAGRSWRDSAASNRDTTLARQGGGGAHCFQMEQATHMSCSMVSMLPLQPAIGAIMLCCRALPVASPVVQHVAVQLQLLHRILQRALQAAARRCMPFTGSKAPLPYHYGMLLGSCKAELSAGWRHNMASKQQAKRPPSQALATHAPAQVLHRCPLLWPPARPARWCAAALARTPGPGPPPAAWLSWPATPQQQMRLLTREATAQHAPAHTPGHSTGCVALETPHVACILQLPASPHKCS